MVENDIPNIKDDDSSENITEELSEQQNPENSTILALEKENFELKDAYLRLSAETDNYRKRIEQEKELYKKIAIRGVVEKILPIMDNLQLSLQASQNSDNIESLKIGISLILKQFEDALADSGVEKILINMGDEFDPQLAEAVLIEEFDSSDDSQPRMIVSEVFQEGYKIAGQIIRPAKVKVKKIKQNS